jgi:hyperosmotically inducible protein
MRNSTILSSSPLSTRYLWTAAGLIATFGLTACNKPTEVTVAMPPAAPPTEASGPAYPASMPASDAPAMASTNVSDGDVTEHVKTALERSPLLQGMLITVQTTKGDVSLTGTLNTQAQVDEATRIARASEGVHAVHDHLSIKP